MLIPSSSQIAMPDALIAGFIDNAGRISKWNVPAIEWDYWQAPHSPKPLRKGCSAVYVFSLAKSVPNGFTCGRVLKVGKAGPNSNARFQSQHYGFSAPSTVSKAIRYNPILWAATGFEFVDPEATGDWLRINTNRTNFYLQGADNHWLALLETYLKAMLGPALEGVTTREY